MEVSKVSTIKKTKTTGVKDYRRMRVKSSKSQLDSEISIDKEISEGNLGKS